MDWNEIILGEQKKPYYESLANHMREEYKGRYSWTGPIS